MAQNILHDSATGQAAITPAEPAHSHGRQPGLTALAIEIEENFGQSAVYRLDLR